MTSLRRSTRSARTPAHGPIIRMGNVLIPTAVPVKKALPSVRCSTSQTTVSIWIHWAPTVKKFPIQRYWKSLYAEMTQKLLCLPWAGALVGSRPAVSRYAPSNHLNDIIVTLAIFRHPNEGPWEMVCPRSIRDIVGQFVSPKFMEPSLPRPGTWLINRGFAACRLQSKLEVY